LNKIKNDSAPYHIAYVIYTHQNVNITLEASADAGNLYYPEFSFYDINPNGNTFHKKYSQYYQNGVTNVLQSRNIDDVLREIDEENSKSKKHKGGKRKKLKTAKTRKIRKTKRSNLYKR
jgi:hypothetical protein